MKFTLEGAPLGLALVVLGAVLILLTALILRVLGQRRVQAGEKNLSPIDPALPAHEQAVLMVHPGGRLGYMNNEARRLFGLNGETPTLEGLARNAHPNDHFLRLCAGEGQARLSIQGQAVAAVSYRVPLTGMDAVSTAPVIVSLRPVRPLFANETAEAAQEFFAPGSLQLFSELNRAMSGSLELEKTLLAVLEGIERWIVTDSCEISLLEPESQFLIPYYKAGQPDAPVLKQGNERINLAQGLAGRLYSERQPLWSNDLDHLLQSQPDLGPVRRAFQSYIGIPLITSGDFVGLLELGAYTPGSFDAPRFEALCLLAGQAALALHNAQLYEKEQQRALELSGLAGLAQSIRSIRDPRDLFARLVQSIAPLLHVEILGFVLLEEARQTLTGQVPFLGIQDSVASWLNISVLPGTPAETAWAQFELIVTPDAAAEERLAPLGLCGLAQAAGMRAAIFAPLLSGGRKLGILCAANPTQAPAFDSHDLRLISILTSQVAPILENATLMEQARQRTQRAETLRRIASLSGSNATLDEILKYSLLDLARLLKADQAAIFLLDRYHNLLNLHQPSVVGDPASTWSQMGAIPLDQVPPPRSTWRLNTLDDLPAEFTSYRAELEKLKIESLILAPCIVRDRKVGLLLLGNASAHFFQEGDSSSVELVAAQLSTAIERSSLFDETDQTLHRRVEIFSRWAETARKLQSEGSLEKALETVAKAFQAVSSFDQVLLAVSQTEGELLAPQAASGLSFEAWQAARLQPLSQAALQAGKAEWNAIGAAYSLPASTQAAWDDSFLGALQGERWMIPLLSAKAELLGAVFLARTGPAYSGELPLADQELFSALEVMAEQAAGVIENDRQRQALQNEIEHLQAGVSAEEQFAQDQREQMHRFEEKEAEQSLMIMALSQRVRHVTTGLEIVTALRQETTRSGLLSSLAQELLEHMGFDTVFVAEQTHGDDLGLILTAGLSPSGSSAEVLFGQRNPLRSVSQSGQMLLQAQVKGSDWENTPLLRAWQAQGFICLPIEEPAGKRLSLLALSQTALSDFTPGDQQLFGLLARQITAALHNLDLNEQSERRMREVNLLLEFSQQISSLEPERILQSLLQSAMRAVPGAQRALALVWNEQENCLLPRAWAGYPHGERLASVSLHLGEGLGGQTFQRMETLLLDELDFRQHHNYSPENLLLLRDATGSRLAVSGLAVPILSATQKVPLGVLVLENAQATGAFSSEAAALLTSLARQTALSLETARLYQASQQRAAQLQALTHVAAEMTSSLETDELIDSLLDRIQSVIPYDTGILWLCPSGHTLDEPLTMTVQAARGFADSDQRQGLRVAVEDSLLLTEMLATCQPLLVPNVQEDSRFPSLLEYERLSWLGVPLVASGQVVGVIALEKSEPYFYTTEHIQLVTTFAGQAAAALENARLFQESNQRAQELDQRSQVLGMLNRLSSELSASLNPSYILNFAMQELQRVLPCSRISALGFDAHQRAFLQAEVPASMASLPLLLPATPLFDHLRQTLGVFHSENVLDEPGLTPLLPFLQERSTRSLLVLPIAASGTMQGLLLAHSDQDIPFEMSEIELARTISNQMAIAVQNARLFAETRSLTEDLEQRVEARTVELEREHRRTETLLKIMTELSASLDLDQVLTRSIEILNQMIDAEQITLLIARPEQKKLHRLASLGYTQPAGTGGSPTPLDHDQGLAGWIIQHRQAALIPDLEQDERWITLAPAPEPHHRSALAVPLMVGADALGALLLFHTQTNHFSHDQLELAQAAANQAAIAVNNAELYRLIRDQAEDLGKMLRNQQVETSRTRSILEAVADGVLVTDSQGSITLFNASAEKILDLPRAQVLGKSLEGFAGLFGSSAQSWRETIQAWSTHPEARQPGESYTQKITLENGRVVEVRLAPVGFKRSFLGTVSVFRDITHQVEVDRLKSEFVATVSHELRTPMTSIKGYVEILLMGAGGPLSDSQTRFLSIVKSNTERLAILVNDLLDISRIESGKATLAFQPVNLEEIAQQAVEDLNRRREEEQKEIHIRAVCAPDLPRVLGDPDRLRQILDNLLDNAYLYNLPQGQIELALYPNGHEVQVDVTDTGMGIPKDEQGRVFERFFRGESPLVLGVSGTGLGLSIVQNLVQMHSGRIWFTSAGTAGQGSTFSFTLPVYEPGLRENS